MIDDTPITPEDEYRAIALESFSENMLQFYPKPEHFDEPEIEFIEDGE